MASSATVFKSTLDEQIPLTLIHKTGNTLLGPGSQKYPLVSKVERSN